MWNLPGPEIKPVSPSLAGRFFTTKPPGKPSSTFCIYFLHLGFCKSENLASTISSSSFFFFPFIFISWRLLLYSVVVVFAIHWHKSAMDLHVFPIPNPPLTSLSIPSLWVVPVHQPRALVSCIQPGLAICFTLDNIHVSMLFSQIIPPLPSPIESKSLFWTSVSLFLSCI